MSADACRRLRTMKEKVGVMQQNGRTSGDQKREGGGNRRYS